MGVSRIIAYTRFPVSLSNAEGGVFVPHVLRAGLTDQKSVLDIRYILYFIIVKKILHSYRKYLTVRVCTTDDGPPSYAI